MKAKRSIAIVALGNILEWYDFILFGAMSTLLAQLFFPDADKALSLLYVFAAFGIGFLMRPIGGIILGHVGDRFGRKKALCWSIALIAIPMFLVGCLPAGSPFGPIALVVLRLIQGMSVGGEFPGAIAFLAEVAPIHRRGFLSSFATMGVMAGIFLGTVVALILTTVFDEASLLSYGWRLPYWIGGLIGIVILFFRQLLPETEVFREEREAHHLETLPIIEAIRHHLVAILQVFGIASGVVMSMYLTFVYMQPFFHQVLGYTPLQAVWINLISISLTMLLIPFFGTLSDRLGRRVIFGWAAILSAILAWPLLVWQVSELTWLVLAITHLIQIFLVAALHGPMSAALAERLETRYRVSGLGLGYNISVAIFGGLAPVFATLLVRSTGLLSSPAFLLCAAGLISWVTILSTTERSRDPIR